MRAGLFYILFVTIALLFVSSKQTTHEQSGNTFSTCQSSMENVNNAGILPAFNDSLKKVFIETNLISFFNQRLYENTIQRRIELPANNLQLFTLKALAIKPPLKYFLVYFYNTSENDDDYHLLA
jgi:hypothetical protein